MDFKIKMLDEAKEELMEILYFITYIRRLEIYAEKVKKKILSEIKILASSPEIFQKLNNKNRYRYGYKYRKMIVDKYIVLYHIDYEEKRVYIVHIYDGRSNYLKSLV